MADRWRGGEEVRRWKPLVGYSTPPDCLGHRAQSATWLRARATNLFAEAKFLAQQESGVKFVGDVESGGRGRSRARGRGYGVAPPEPDEQANEWAGVSKRYSEMERLAEGEEVVS